MCAVPMLSTGQTDPLCIAEDRSVVATPLPGLVAVNCRPVDCMIGQLCPEPVGNLAAIVHFIPTCMADCIGCSASICSVMNRLSLSLWRRVSCLPHLPARTQTSQAKLTKTFTSAFQKGNWTFLPSPSCPQCTKVIKATKGVPAHSGPAHI